MGKVMSHVSSIEFLFSSHSILLLRQKQGHINELRPHIAQLVLPHISKGHLIQSFITGQHRSIIVVDNAPTLAFNYI